MIDSLYYMAPISLLILLLLGAASVRILREYERAVVFTLGRFDMFK